MSFFKIYASKTFSHIYISKPKFSKDKIEYQVLREKLTR